MEKIVIIGGGFAGINAYLEFHRRYHGKAHKPEIVMISESDKFLFTPLIHEVATGTLSPDDVTQSIRQIASCCLTSLIEAKVENINVDTQRIFYKTQGETKSISYDYIILATGAETNFFNVSGAKEHALTLRSIRDVRKLKNRIIENFEQAQYLPKAEQKKLLRFIIVGGGPTGVELAGEMGDLFGRALRIAFPTLQDVCEIILVEGQDRLVCRMEDWFSKKTAAILEKKGRIKILCGVRISKVTKHGAQVGDEFMESNFVLWAAGVQARDLPIEAKKGIERDERSKRIKVNSYLQSLEYENMFVVGDQAWIFDKEENLPYPMRAQFAVREGRTAAKNIAFHMAHQRMKEFAWDDMGFVVSLGKGGALANLGGIKFSGLIAWFMYRGAYLFAMTGLRAKVRTAAEWLVNLFLPRDISKL